MQQLETCNDIETAIIAAARAAAAAATSRSASCTRSNSQDEQAATTATVAAVTETAKTRPALLMTCGDAGESAGQDVEAQLRELSFMPDLKSDYVGMPLLTLVPTLLPTPMGPPSLTSNTEIVEYIRSSWNAIVNSKHVTFYNEQEDPQK